MSRLILLIVFGLCAAYYFPDSRQMMLDASEPLREPIDRWITREEMTQIANDVLAYEQRTGQVPDRRGWIDWLKWRYQVEESTRDAWGTTYELKVWPDSVGIVSYGPDRTRSSEDDFAIVLLRSR